MDADKKSFLLEVEKNNSQCPINGIVGDKNQTEERTDFFM
jgi:hypothetical protein